MKVLLAGRDEDVGALATPLASAGWKVLSASDAATALMLARSDPPDAVVVAAALPGGRGHGLVERLRHLAPTSMVPVIGLATDREPVGALEAAGADRTLPTGGDPDALLAMLVEVAGSPAAAEPTTPMPRSLSDSGPSQAGVGRVLVIEDDDSVRGMLSQALELEGHEVAALASANAVLDSCRADPPDVVLLDVMLPGLSGLDLLSLLKADPALHHLPVLLVSARDDDTVVEGLRRGAHDYVRKPFDLTELLVRVEGALATKRAHDELAGYATRLESSALIDLTTGVDNRRSAEIHLERMTSQASRTRRPLALLLLAVASDAHARTAAGADVTDRAARAVAERLVSVCRTADVLARWDREQFVVLLPNTDREGAEKAAERVTDALVAGSPGAVADDTPTSATLAFGVATLRDGPGQLVADAQAAMERARAEGRSWTVQVAAETGDGTTPGLLGVERSPAPSNGSVPS